MQKAGINVIVMYRGVLLRPCVGTYGFSCRLVCSRKIKLDRS